MKLLLAGCLAVSALACTNILVSKGASKDGSTMIAYNADSGGLYGSLGHYPAKDHPAGAMRTNLQVKKARQISTSARVSGS